MAGNSWQSPVASEPSLGTLHPHSYQILNNYDPASTPTTYNVDLTAQIPANNSRLIWVYGYFSALTAGRTLSIRDTSGHTYGMAGVQVANIYSYFGAFVRLGTDYTIRFYFDNADCYGAYCWMELYGC